MRVTETLVYDSNILLFGDVLLYFPKDVTFTGSDTFFFPHVCAIYRSEGQVNEVGDEIFTAKYYGDCSYELGASGNTRYAGMTFQADAVLLIPSTDILFQINDHVAIETENGRLLKATIEQFETVNEDGIQGTTIWLKNAQ